MREDSPHRDGRNGLIWLGAAALALEVVLAVGFLAPLALWEHGDVIEGHQPIAELLGVGQAGAWRLFATIVCAFLAFAFAAWVARGLSGRRACVLVLAGTLLFIVTLVPTNPAGAQDVYHNIADARTLWVHGDNPAVTPPDAHPDDPFHAHVPVWTDYSSSYGPLWYLLSGVGLPVAGSELWPNVIAQKLLTAVFLLATTVLVMLTASRIRPGSAPLAGVLVGWNPLLLVDTAGNAHNDIVMVAFAVASFYALMRRWWIAGFVLLALAIAVKHVLVILGPLVLLWMIRRGDVPARTIAASLLAGVVVAAAFYVPFLAGGEVLGTMARESDHFLASPGSVIVSLLTERTEMDSERAAWVMKLVLVPVFLAGYALVVWKMWRADPGDDGSGMSALVAASAWTVFVFLVTVKWWFWPWYVMWLVPIAALTPRRPEALLAAVFSFTAMLMYVVYYWQVYDHDWRGTQRQTAAVIFLVPLALAAVLLVRRWWAARWARR